MTIRIHKIHRLSHLQTHRFIDHTPKMNHID